MLNRSEITPDIEKAILLKEMDLLQKIFDKYDGWIFKLRAACVTSVVALSITHFNDQPHLASLGCFIPPMAWVIEGLIRWDHWYGYVERYNTIRHFLNARGGTLHLYDLKNYRGSISNSLFSFARLKTSFLKIEPITYYLFLFLFCFFVVRISKHAG